jgi:hypothetical protein
MTSIFDLDHTRRRLNTGDVRKACGSPSPNTWARYRAILGIKNNSLTEREAFLLWVAIQNYYHSPGASKTAIYQAAAAILVQSPGKAATIARLCGSEGVKGADLGEAIGLATGIYPDESTLYRWVEKNRLGKHSRRRLYQGRTIARLCSIALQSRAKFGNRSGAIA